MSEADETAVAEEAEPGSSELENLEATLRDYFQEVSRNATGVVRESLAKLAEHVNRFGVLCKVPDAVLIGADSSLQVVRDLASRFEIKLLPSEWSYLKPKAPEEANLETQVVFRPEEPCGTLLRLKQFGLMRGEELLQPAIVSISAGQAPVGFPELEQTVAEVPELAPLIETLRGWRQASLEGVLEQAACELYITIWDQYRGFGLEELLLPMMQESFGFTPFYPARVQEQQPGWVVLVDGSRLASGRVREVRRPGLMDAAGNLRVPAYVVAE